MAYAKCYMVSDDNGSPNTMHWRVAEFKTLSKELTTIAPITDIEDHQELCAQEAVDTLFMNIPAKGTFQHFKGIWNCKRDRL